MTIPTEVIEAARARLAEHQVLVSEETKERIQREETVRIIRSEFQAREDALEAITKSLEERRRTVRELSNFLTQAGGEPLRT